MATNHGVGGSNPPGRARCKSHPQKGWLFLLLKSGLLKEIFKKSIQTTGLLGTISHFLYNQYNGVSSLLKCNICVPSAAYWPECAIHPLETRPQTKRHRP